MSGEKNDKFLVSELKLHVDVLAISQQKTLGRRQYFSHE